MTVVLVNAELAVRDWLKTVPEVAAVVGGSIFIGVPPEVGRREGAYPLIGVHRVYSAAHPYLPVDQAALQLDCWGPLKSQRRAFEAAAAVVDALWSLVPNTALTADVTAKGVYDITTQWQPDTVSDRPRYAVGATVMCAAPALPYLPPPPPPTWDDPVALIDDPFVTIDGFRAAYDARRRLAKRGRP